MIKKFVAWVKSLFVPVTIKETNVDEYIAAQQRRTYVEPDDVVLSVTVKGDQETARATETLSTVRFVQAEERGIDEPVKENEVITGVDIANGTVNVTTVEIKPIDRNPATPPKRLNEQLKEVELPSYAQGKKLPPKAKRKYIAEAKRPVSRDLRSQDTPLDPSSAMFYGVGAAAILSSDDSRSSVPAEAPVRVEECSPAPSHTPSHSDSTPSHHSSSSSDSYSSSSSSSYDSGSSYSDSSSSSSSCD